MANKQQKKVRKAHAKQQKIDNGKTFPRHIVGRK
jgi:hypothetical protein